MESEKQLDLTWLFPDFSTFTYMPHNGTQLSTLFIVILLVVAGIFAAVFLYHFVKTQLRVGWLKKQLKNLDRSNILLKRETLRLAAESKEDSVGHLWLEFDETLVEVKTSDTTLLSNTLDAGHFFNTHTLAKEVTENRLIAAVPGFLTAIGVIGTFVGLQLGLGGLQLGSGISVDQMQDGISSVVNGAKVAFLTSVWGVALSVIFNFGEKWFEQRVRNNIRSVENTIDHLFPRIRPEDQLQIIAEHGAESREALQGLAEKIGTKMQEAMVTATQGIQTSLEKSLSEIMAPAINQLVDTTSEGNQKALDGLLENFMEGFGEQGTQQRQALDDVSEKVNRSVEAMQTSMNGFVEQLQNSQSDSGEREKELIADISNQVSRLVTQSDDISSKLTGFVESKVDAMTTSLDAREQASAKREADLVASITQQVSELVINSREQGKTLTDFVETQLTGVTQKLDQRDERVAQREDLRDQKITAQSEAVNNMTEQMLASVEASINKQVGNSSILIQQGQTLQNSIETSVQANAQATLAMKESATELRVSADRMSVLGSHISEAGNKLSGAIKDAVESTRDLSQQNQLSAERMEKLREQLITDVAKFDQLTVQLTGMLATAGTTFSELKSSQREYISQLKTEVTALSSQMTSSLEDYATQANGTTATHLKVWSDSVTQYSTQMTSAVKALSNVVDSIEEKVG
jgi:hypothetical protein